MDAWMQWNYIATELILLQKLLLPLPDTWIPDCLLCFEYGVCSSTD